MDDDLDFEYGEGVYTEEGCGAILMGEMWYFGGSRHVCFIKLVSC